METGTGRGGATSNTDGPVPLSVLDLATYGSGDTAADALRTTTSLARLADRRGFRRFWVAEHHGVLGISSSSPAVLAAHLAAQTETIRLGSGGVILPNHTPLVIAEQFGMLEALHPGRIDLGIGRSAGADPVTARALRPNTAEFPDQVAELMGFLNDSFPAGHPYANVHAIPGKAAALGEHGQGGPAPWLLGTSERGGRLAGRLGLPFAFGYHLAPDMTEPALTAYRESFTASAFLQRPYAMVSVSVITADSTAGAYRLARRELLRPPPGSARPAAALRSIERHRMAALVKAHLEERLKHITCGAPPYVRDELDQLVKSTDADELMLVSPVCAREPRLRVFELIADIYGMAEIRHSTLV